MSERDQKIRQRAYEIWEREGRPDGNHGEHWDRAAREIDEQEAAPAGDPTGTGHRGPAGPGGLSTGLQPGGMSPGGGPAAGAGSIGTGGASSAGRASGSVKHSGS
jgi:hypothetical protein